MKAKHSKTAPWTKSAKIKLKASLNHLLSLFRFNITFKLTLGYTFHIASLLLFISGLCYLGIAFFGMNHLLENMGSQAKVVEQMLLSDDPDGEALLNRYLKSEQLRLYAVDAAGLPYKGRVANSKSFIESANETQVLTPRALIALPPLVVKGQLTLKDKQVLNYALELPLDGYLELRNMVFTLGGLIWFLLVLGSGAEMSRMAKQHLKPIHAMNAQVRDISSNNLNVRLNVSGTRDELKDLALTFNRMLEEIEGTYDREKQFVSDASHELRTPISVIKGYANLLRRWGKSDPTVLDEGIDAIVAETDNMQRLVEDLLFIARHEQNRRQVSLEAIDLSELIRDIVRESELIDPFHNFSAQIKPDIRVLASTEHLKQALRIFVDNAIKYTPKGGDIRFKLDASQSTALLAIKDTGIGISEEDLPHIFDRFFRADKSRTRLSEEQVSGSGLGLAIAKIILERHDAKIYVESVVGGGTEISILLPLIK